MRHIVLSVSVFVLVLHVVSGALAAPRTNAAPPTPPADYVLGPGDQVDITVYGHPDLTETATIKPWVGGLRPATF